MADWCPIFLDIYDFFVVFAKKRRDESEAAAVLWLKEKLIEIRQQAHIRQGQFFTYSIERKGKYNWLSPYEKLDGLLWDLSSGDNFFYSSIGKFFRYSNDVNYKFCPIYISRSYQEWPYNNNINGVNGYLDPKAWKYIRRYVRKTTRRYTKQYGDRSLWVKISNELGHGGNRKRGVKITWWHEAVYDLIAKFGIKNNRFITDVSHSDFTKLAEKNVLLVDNQLMKLATWEALPEPKPAIAIVDGKQAIFGRDEFDRKAVPEDHNVNPVTLAAPVEPGASQTLWENIQSPSWRRRYLSGDGNNGWGTGYQIPGTSFCEPTKQELYDYYKFIFDYKAANPQSTRIVMGLFPMHVIVKDPATGYYYTDIDRLDLEWCKQPYLAWVDAGRPKMF